MEIKHVLLSVLRAAQRGLFSFLPRMRGKFCRAVQADLSLFFSVGSLTRLVTRTILSVYLKAHTSSNAAVVLLSRNGLESIPCSWKSLFTEGERSTREVLEALGSAVVDRALARCQKH